MSNETWMHIGLHGHSVGTFVAEPKGIRWKSALTTDDDDIVLSRFIPSTSIIGAKWTVFGPSAHLRIQTKDPKLPTTELRFDGFPPNEYDKLRNVLSSLFEVDLKKHSMSSAGSSFGLTNITNKHLVFRQCELEDADEEGEEFEPRDGDEMMSMNTAEVTQCVMQGNTRNEIELQFHESDAVEAGTDQLVSVRFYVPPDADTDHADTETETPAEIFQQRILNVANIKNTAGNEIIQFTEKQGTFLTPRGRYKVTLYDSHLRMYGNRYDYKIKYEDISRLFLLPRPDDVHMAFVIALDKPIRQGQQRYQILVLHTTKDTEEIEVNLDSETLQKEYKGELQPVMRGQLCNLIAKSFKCIAKKKVFITGKFANAYQQACVKCALRANEGQLYPLEKCFVFIHKPPVIIRFNEVESVEFQRYAGGQGSTRNFDLCVTLMKSTGDLSPTKEYIFSGIDRSDYAGLYNFLSGKSIKIKNIQESEDPNQSAMQAAVQEMMREEDDDESDDEDFSEGGGSSSSEEDDDDDVDDDGSIDSDLEEARKKAKKMQKSQKRPASEPVLAKKQVKKKSKKDPNAPKRAKTSFMCFNEKMRPKLKEQNPDASFGDLAKLVGRAFRELSDEKKSKYEQLAEEDKKRYKEEMANYSAPENDDDEESSAPTSKAKGKKKDPNAPKRGGNAYTFFVREMRPKFKAENPEASFGELGKIIGQKFKELSDQDKEKYKEMAEKDKIRYNKEMENYTPPETSSSDKKTKSKPAQVQKKEIKAAKLDSDSSSVDSFSSSDSGDSD